MRRGARIVVVALLAGGLAVPGLLAQEVDEEKKVDPLMERLEREAKETARGIRELEEEIVALGEERLGPPEAPPEDSPYGKMQEVRAELYEARARRDAQLHARRFLRRLEEAIEAGDWAKEEKARMRADVERLFQVYHERRLARLEARRGLGDALAPGRRTEAEELLTLREQQLQEARMRLRSYLQEAGILWPEGELS